MTDAHFEPFLHLVDTDDDQALIAWGGFWFHQLDDGSWRTVDDERLGSVDEGRTESIGVRSEPYGAAVVEVFDESGRLAGRAETATENHVWITGLTAASQYRYEVTVDGAPWAPAECMSWHRIDADRGELRPAGRTYDCRFRTFPAPDEAETLRFVALGDYGVGIQTASENGDHQLHVARILEGLTESERGIDLVITLGDNIYHEEGESIGGSGREDDDWYFSFYEPYRFVLNRVPVYPTVGNHDGAETEASDDRGQLADNHFTDVRFAPEVEADRDTLRLEGDRLPGLFYRFSYGRLAEFVCIDTSEATEYDVDRYFDDPQHEPFLDDAFDPERGDRSGWLIPFAHHPAYTAGPHHGNDDAQIRSLLPRYRRAGVRLVLAGHEHNFQHSQDGDMHLFVCGAGGKLHHGRPERFDEARTVSWAARPHLLLVDVDVERVTLLPVGDLDERGAPVPIEAEATDGSPVRFPLVIDA